MESFRFEENSVRRERLQGWGVASRSVLSRIAQHGYGNVDAADHDQIDDLRSGPGILISLPLLVFVYIALLTHTSHSFEPPSTGMLAPVIQRAPSDTTKATTSATSSGLPSRFNACIPNVTSRPASVFVKFDMSEPRRLFYRFHELWMVHFIAAGANSNVAQLVWNRC